MKINILHNKYKLKYNELTKVNTEFHTLVFDFIYSPNNNNNNNNNNNIFFICKKIQSYYISSKTNYLQIFYKNT